MLIVKTSCCVTSDSLETTSNLTNENERVKHTVQKVSDKKNKQKQKFCI